MDTFAHAARVADKLKRGALPAAKPIKMWAGFGNGRTCAGCDDPILGADVEHELDFEDGRTLRFHAACALLWQRMTGA